MKRYFMRDESGRGFCCELHHNEFTEDERSHCENELDEFPETFGEWLDNADIGETYENTDENHTVTRIA
jgi:hypothetical protein